MSAFVRRDKRSGCVALPPHSHMTTKYLAFKLVVVAANGENVDMRIIESMYEPVLLAKPSRPESSQVVA